MRRVPSSAGAGQILNREAEIAKEANLVYAASRAWQKGQSVAPLAEQAFRCRGPTTIPAAQVTSVQANTAIRFLMGLRRLISSELPSYQFNAEI